MRLFLISREFSGKSSLLQNMKQSQKSMLEMSWRNPQDFAEDKQKNSSGKSMKENQLHDSETSCSEPGIQQVNVCCSTVKYDQHKQSTPSSHIPAAQNKQRYKVYIIFTHSNMHNLM